MQIHQVGDRVQLLLVDHPFNNSVGYVSAVDAPRDGLSETSMRGRAYQINFDGQHKSFNWYKDICVVRYDDQPKGPAPVMDGLHAIHGVLALSGVAPLMVLPPDPVVRKGMPITTGVLDYFPLALAEVAKCSKAGNDQHNPGQPLHWDKTKSTDHADCMARHLIDRGSIDTDGIRHSAKLAWRALANLQMELEAQQGKK